MGNRDAPGVGLENSPGILLDFCASTDNSGNPQNYPSTNQGNIHVSPWTMSWTVEPLIGITPFPGQEEEGLCVSQVSEIEINRTLVSPPVSRIAPPG